MCINLLNHVWQCFGFHFSLHCTINQSSLEPLKQDYAAMGMFAFQNLSNSKEIPRAEYQNYLNNLEEWNESQITY